MARPAFSIAGVNVEAGSRTTVDLPLPKLNLHTDLSMPVHVIYGKRDGQEQARRERITPACV